MELVVILLILWVLRMLGSVGSLIIYCWSLQSYWYCSESLKGVDLYNCQQSFVSINFPFFIFSKDQVGNYLIEIK